MASVSNSPHPQPNHGRPLLEVKLTQTRDNSLAVNIQSWAPAAAMPRQFSLSLHIPALPTVNPLSPASPQNHVSCASSAVHNAADPVPDQAADNNDTSDIDSDTDSDTYSHAGPQNNLDTLLSTCSTPLSTDLPCSTPVPGSASTDRLSSTCSSTYSLPSPIPPLDLPPLAHLDTSGTESTESADQDTCTASQTAASVHSWCDRNLQVNHAQTDRRLLIQHLARCTNLRRQWRQEEAKAAARTHGPQQQQPDQAAQNLPWPRLMGRYKLATSTPAARQLSPRAHWLIKQEQEKSASAFVPCPYPMVYASCKS